MNKELLNLNEAADKIISDINKHEENIFAIKRKEQNMLLFVGGGILVLGMIYIFR